jgi:hypothetical protein
MYDGIVPTPVRILQQNWDYYYEEDFDKEPPHLNADGLAFYVVYGAPSGSPPDPATWWSRSRTCMSLDEAIQVAQEALGSSLAWDAPTPEGGR